VADFRWSATCQKKGDERVRVSIRDRASFTGLEGAMCAQTSATPPWRAPPIASAPETPRRRLRVTAYPN
jgi:hypothetical protein